VMSGFLEGAAREFYLRLAREAYEGVLGSGGAAGDVPLKLARVHLLLGGIAQAADLLDELARERPDDLDVRLARMEVIYEFGDLRELRLYARRALPKVPDDAPERALFEWWAAEEAGFAH
jgi:polysaccharide biosynthesis protein PelE